MRETTIAWAFRPSKTGHDSTHGQTKPNQKPGRSSVVLDKHAGDVSATTHNHTHTQHNLIDKAMLPPCNNKIIGWRLGGGTHAGAGLSCLVKSASAGVGPRSKWQCASAPCHRVATHPLSVLHLHISTHAQHAAEHEARKSRPKEIMIMRTNKHAPAYTGVLEEHAGFADYANFATRTGRLHCYHGYHGCHWSLVSSVLTRARLFSHAVEVVQCMSISTSFNFSAAV